MLLRFWVVILNVLALTAPVGAQSNTVILSTTTSGLDPLSWTG